MKYLITFLSAIILGGCAASSIKIKPSNDLNPYSMFGKYPSRNFIFENSISDSLVKKWEAEIHGGFTNSSISVYDNFVFVNDLSGRVFCFDINSGKTIGQLKNKGAVYTTPVIEHNQIIYAVANEKENTSTLIYYNYLEGREAHTNEIKGRVLTQFIKVSDGIIFNSEIGKVYKYNFSGDKNWEIDTKSFTHSSPAMENNIILFGNDKGEIISVSSDKGKILYKKKISHKPFFSGPSFNNGTAYIGNDDGHLYSIEPQSGDVKWKFDSKSRITMTPVVNNNEAIVGNLSGNLFSINIENGNKVWELKTNGVLDVTPLVTKNYVLLPDLDKKFYLVDLKNGKVDKTINLSGRVKLSPVIAKNLLFIGYDNGVLDAYEF